MAITINLKVTPTDVPNSIAQMDATWTDTSAGSVVSASLKSADVSTPELEAVNWPILNEKYLVKRDAKTQLDTLVAALEGRGTTALEALL